MMFCANINCELCLFLYRLFVQWWLPSQRLPDWRMSAGVDSILDDNSLSQVVFIDRQDSVEFLQQLFQFPPRGRWQRGVGPRNRESTQVVGVYQNRLKKDEK